MFKHKVTVVVGGQYGSEAKGKAAAYLASEFVLAVRTGGSNAGHTVVQEGTKYVVRYVPCAFVNPGCQLALGAGALIDLSVLQPEIASHGLTPGRFAVDPQSVLIEARHIEAERTSELNPRIGSTAKGVGAAAAEKVWRTRHVRLARDEPSLAPYCRTVSDLVHRALEDGRVLIEGTQGTGLSIHHGHYPYVTGRETTAGSLCGEVGIGPTSVDRVVLVVRTYPIRVGGNSGPLENEVSWETVTAESGSATPLEERTTVTNRVRRVAQFDMRSVVHAARLNGATELCLTFADYITSDDAGITTFAKLSHKTQSFVSVLEKATELRVTLISTGPDTAHMVDRR